MEVMGKGVGWVGGYGVPSPAIGCGIVELVVDDGIFAIRVTGEGEW